MQGGVLYYKLNGREGGTRTPRDKRRDVGYARGGNTGREEGGKLSSNDGLIFARGKPEAGKVFKLFVGGDAYRGGGKKTDERELRQKNNVSLSQAGRDQRGTPPKT